MLIVAAEAAKKPAVARAVDQVRSVGGKVVGVTLNKVDFQSNSYYYKEYYGDYHSSYYADGKGYGERPREDRRRRPRPQRSRSATARRT